MIDCRVGSVCVLLMCTLVGASGEPVAAGCSIRQSPNEGALAATAGDTAVPSLTALKDGRYTREFVDKILPVWRHRLNLDEWDISVMVARRRDLKPNTRGMIRWDKDKKSAVIYILDAADYPLPLCEMLDDVEFTVVHELLHLELSSLPRSEASRRTEERAVNSITAALLKLARQQ